MTNVAPQDRDVTVNGLKLHYLDWGNKRRTPLICLHGHTGQCRIWDDFARAMQPHFHVLTVDQRGHGDSQWAPTYARDTFVQDLAALIDHFGFQRVVLCGLSMGGWNALLYTQQQGEKVEKVVLVDIAPELNPEATRRFRTNPPPEAFDSLDQVVQYLRSNNPWATLGRLQEDARHSARVREDGKIVWKCDPKLRVGTMEDTTPPFVARYWQALEEVSRPVLLVRGAESELVTDEVARRMEKKGKAVSWVDVSGAGHIVCMDNPADFTERVAQFLGTTSLSG